jgi:glycosyltransferase involved in cell wall biosynthesis
MALVSDSVDERSPLSVQASLGLPRVLMVADHIGYAGGVVHGATTYFLEVLPELVQAGVKLTTCFLRDPHPAAEGLRSQGIVPTFLSAARMNPFVVLRIAAIARRNGCTVLHAMGIKAILMARLATRLVSAQTILHLHDMVEPSLLVGHLQRTLARPSDMAVCVSRAIAPIATRRYNVCPERTRVIHNGIRLERFQNVSKEVRAPLRSSMGLDERAHVLLLVGRMHPIKGHQTMLSMMPAIVSRCPDVVLLLAGDGPDRAACETMVRDLGLERHVRFLGQRRDVPELLEACDIVVIPSQAEGLPIAAIEAHAAGRPVVGFGCGGVGEVVHHGMTGRVVPAADSDAFVNATTALLLDEKTRGAYGTEARRVAQSFSLDTHVQQVLRCYRDIARTREDQVVTRPMAG